MAALAGSTIGAVTSFVTTWITQSYQGRQLRQSNESSRRERLFGDFIDQASTLYANATVSSLEDPTKLVMLYATLSKLRLFASDATIAAATTSLDTIIQTYRSPNVDFGKGEFGERDKVDILRSFTDTARRELQS